MEAETTKMEKKNESLKRNISTAVGVLKSGGIVAAATETFFGILADIYNEKAVMKVKRLKGLAPNAPMLLIASYKDIEKLVIRIHGRAGVITKRYWPGPVTVIFHARISVPHYLLGPYSTIAVRVPGECDAWEILNQFGSPLTATSCNIHGQPPFTTSRQVHENFKGRVDFIVPGSAPGGLPSTIIDVTVNPPALRRRGIVNIEGKYLK